MKKWYRSRTIWASVFVMLTTILALSYGVEIKPEYEAAYFTILAIVLRIVTHEELEA